MPNHPEENHPPIYRAYRVTTGSRITGAPVILEATHDEEAIAQARRLVDGVGIELWDRSRLVIFLPPKGQDDG